MRFLALLALTFTVAACSGAHDSTIAPGPDQIVRLSDSEIKGLDPQKISDLSSLRVAADLFEGLTRFDARGKVEPGLASDWRVSEDGLSWTFTIRDGLEFADSEPIASALFPQILDRLRADGTAAPARALFDNIVSITAPTAQEIVVKLAAPDPALPSLLAHPALAAIPLHRIKVVGDRWTADRPMLTSGAYRLEDWRLNDHARLTRNPAWHDQPAPTATIIWKPMDDSLSSMRLFLSGGADIASDYPASRHQWLMENHSGAARSVSYLGSYYFAFNTRQPPFDDARVRRALSMAVERQWIADEVMGIGNQPAWGLLPPGLSDEPLRPSWADWPRDQRLAEARDLLAKVGYGPDRPLRFEIRFNSSAEHRRVSVALAAMWRPLHVEASPFNTEAALHFAALRQQDFALARSGWIADLPTPENFLKVHQPANGTGNYSGYNSAAYDRLLASAIAQPDPGRRQQMMRAAEQQLIDDMPILPLYFYVTRSLVAPRIAGWQDNISNVHPSRTLRIEEP